MMLYLTTKLSENMKKHAGKIINLKMQVMVTYRHFAGKHGIWKRVTEHVASVQWLDKQQTRNFYLLTHSLLLPLSCFFSIASCSRSLLRSIAKLESYKRASFSTNQHVIRGKAFKNNMMKFVKWHVNYFRFQHWLSYTVRLLLRLLAA